MSASEVPETRSLANSVRDIKVRVVDKVKNTTQLGAKEFIYDGRGADGGKQDDLDCFRDLKTDPAFNPTAVAKKLESEHAALGNRSNGLARGNGDGTNGGGGSSNSANIAVAAAKPSVVDKIKNAVDVSTSVLAHPRRTAKDKAKRLAADKIASIHRPHSLPREQLEFLSADESLVDGSSRSSLTPGVSEDDLLSSGSERDDDGRTKREKADENLRQRRRRSEKAKLLAERREKMQIAWSTRHARRARVVRRQLVPFPTLEDFAQKDEQGDILRYRWEGWIGHALLYFSQDFNAIYVDDFDELSFDLDTMRTHLERLVLASAPWQIWAMQVRKVYRWDDPGLTARWLLLYMGLWYTEYIMGFLWAFIIYFVVRNRFFPSSLRHLRASMKRSLDLESAVFQLGELIDRHGREEWLSPFVDQLAPFIQLQLGDLADLLEILANFYTWKSPKKTLWSLSFFASCLAISLFSDLDFCIKVFWLILGGAFFFCWPISSQYPKYRFLVSPFRWVFWDIPTHAEWSFEYLRRQCQQSRLSLMETSVEGSDKGRVDGREFQGKADSRRPRVRVSRASDSENPSHNDDDDGSDDEIGSEQWDTANSSPAEHEKDTPSGSVDLVSFRAVWGKVPGRLLVGTSGIRFLIKHKRRVAWILPYQELQELRKFYGKRAQTTDSTIGSIVSRRKLELQRTDGRTYELKLLRDRDEAFNFILGFSNLRWQSLQSFS